MENVLVIGANGKTGKIISRLLKESKRYTPYAMIRNEDQKSHFQDLDIETRYGDLEKDFSDAFNEIDKVIFAAGSGGATGDDKTLAVDEEGAIKAIEYAASHKIEKFVMLSTMGTDNPEQVKRLEQYLRSKKVADDHLRESKLQYTIVQPGGLSDEEGNEKVEVAKKLKKYGEIPREDVAKALIYSLDTESVANTSFEMVSGKASLEETLKSYHQD